MIDALGLTKALPSELRASLPPELRGTPRDRVRLMVIDRARGSIAHRRFNEIGEFLQPGDLLVVNSSRTLPAALPATRQGGEPVQLRICVRRPGAWDVLAVQPAPPHENMALRPGERLQLSGTVADVVGRRDDLPLLWVIRPPADGLKTILESGEPIRYSYVPDPVPLSYYQTVYASHPGSAEAPSAGRAFSWRLILELRRAGVEMVDIVLHTGLSSYQDDAVDAEHHLYEEWYEVGAAAVAATQRARRVIAVGTTVVRALESAVDERGVIAKRRGWTRLRIEPTTKLRAVDGLVTGLHEPQASHFDMLRAFIPGPLLERAYAEAVAGRYLWHEFGDTMLVI